MPTLENDVLPDKSALSDPLGNLEFESLPFEERLRRKLKADFQAGFWLKGAEHFRRPLEGLGIPDFFYDSDTLEAGFTTQTKAGNLIDVALHECVYSSYLTPHPPENHYLTFRLRSPQGVKISNIRVEKISKTIFVDGVKLQEAYEKVGSLTLRPRLTQKELKDFFQNYLDSQVDEQETLRRLEEIVKEYQENAKRNARLAGQTNDKRQVVAFYRGAIFSVWPDVVLG